MLIVGRRFWSLQLCIFSLLLFVKKHERQLCMSPGLKTGSACVKEGKCKKLTSSIVSSGAGATAAAAGQTAKGSLLSSSRSQLILESMRPWLGVLTVLAVVVSVLVVAVSVRGRLVLGSLLLEVSKLVDKSKSIWLVDLRKLYLPLMGVD